MAVEIERRFLVADASVLEEAGGPDRPAGARLEQGYLPVEAPASVRVRLTDDGRTRRAWLTIKHGRSARRRLEFEYEIPVADAEEMLVELCGTQRVRKQRHTLEHRGARWELDRFEGDNAPLLLAEIELPDENAPFDRPPWLGAEVTDDVRLANVNLCARPLAQWPTAERDALLAGRPEEDDPT